MEDAGLPSLLLKATPHRSRRPCLLRPAHRALRKKGDDNLSVWMREVTRRQRVLKPARKEREILAHDPSQCQPAAPVGWRSRGFLSHSERGQTRKHGEPVRLTPARKRFKIYILFRTHPSATEV